MLGTGNLSAERVGLKVPFGFFRDLTVAAGRRRCLVFDSIGSNRGVPFVDSSRTERPGFHDASGRPRNTAELPGWLGWNRVKCWVQ